MALFISALASGSNGNCYYIGNEKEAVLVDAGIPCREIEKRMKRLALSPAKIKALFVSHEHTDHIRGIPVFAKKYSVPIYITDATLSNCDLYVDKGYTRTFSSYEPVRIGNIRITAFPKSHDAADPCSFILEQDGVTVGVFTDIGRPCPHVTGSFGKCHAAFLETNYDEAMLQTGPYPFYLKNRIRGDRGHLSNRQAVELFRKHRPPFMTHLILSHLSKNNNTPELVTEAFRPYAADVQMVVASRYNETEVFKVTLNEKTGVSPIHYRPVSTLQLELFG
jgi:phosphoribosyl 1,2-cyclic phosphodiesterase